MTDPTGIARVAAGLTRAQREAMTGRITHIAKRDPLVAAGILTNDGGRNWTPLGLAVRDYILREKSGG